MTHLITQSQSSCFVSLAQFLKISLKFFIMKFFKKSNQNLFFQLRSEFETFSTKGEKSEKFEVAIDISEDLDEDSLLFVTFCVK